MFYNNGSFDNNASWDCNILCCRSAFPVQTTDALFHSEWSLLKDLSLYGIGKLLFNEK